jgi:hypothetical protein
LLKVTPEKKMIYPQRGELSSDWLGGENFACTLRNFAQSHSAFVGVKTDPKVGRAAQLGFIATIGIVHMVA